MIALKPFFLFFLFMLTSASFIFAQTDSRQGQNPPSRLEFNEVRAKSINNENDIRRLKEDVGTIESSINEYGESIGDHNSKINELTEDRSVILENLTKYKSEINNVSDKLNDLEKREVKANEEYLNQFWILIAAVLVFFMQAGFKVLEVGFVRERHGNAVGIKNFIDWLGISIIFYVVGFGIMYGNSVGGLFGFSLFAPNHDDLRLVNANHNVEFFLYQLTFAATAVTIVSGAISERIKLNAYLGLILTSGILIYPVIGHHVWGGYFLPDNSGKVLLGSIGFMDFAGSSVVHSVGAWIALVWCFFLGDRTGRNNVLKFDESANKKEFKSSSLGYSILGVFLLWFGWWGFNGGSTLAYDFRVARIIQNTNIAGAAGGITALILSMNFKYWRNSVFQMAIGGALGGLVAITACCQMVTATQALILGFLAGIVHNLSWLLIKWCKIDDAVGAIPVHGFCGILGTLFVAAGNPLLFAKNEGVVKQALTKFASDQGINLENIGNSLPELIKGISEDFSKTPDQLLEIIGTKLVLETTFWGQLWIQVKGVGWIGFYTLIASFFSLWLVNYVLSRSVDKEAYFGYFDQRIPRYNNFIRKNLPFLVFSFPHVRVTYYEEQKGDILGTDGWNVYQKLIEWRNDSDLQSSLDKKILKAISSWPTPIDKHKLSNILAKRVKGLRKETAVTEIKEIVDTNVEISDT
ncbi:MAG: hypothetical protein F6K19_26565 [Cyanothece sp. SIO1E1]|nr:hypothetical protein [Cyanothece sp. SIO1E1]